MVPQGNAVGEPEEGLVLYSWIFGVHVNCRFVPGASTPVQVKVTGVPETTELADALNAVIGWGEVLTVTLVLIEPAS